jgi:hypothetical protein
MTYYGGSGADDGDAMAVDATGDAFITGPTTSSDFPLASSVTAFQGTLAGTQNAFLLELNPTGSKATYATYLGGSAADIGLGIALDGSGNVYLTGQAGSTDFPVTNNATQAATGGATDAFVSVINPSASTPLVFSTYLGGGGDEDQVSGSIAVSSNNSFFVTGDTDSGNGTTSVFPTVNAVDPTFGGGTCTLNNAPAICTDGFITAYTAVQ